MITAAELLKTIYNEGSGAGGDSYNEGDIERIMIKFAKLHVTEALKQASEKASTSYSEEPLLGEVYNINKESILNAYPLDNIK